MHKPFSDAVMDMLVSIYLLLRTVANISTYFYMIKY